MVRRDDIVRSFDPSGVGLDNGNLFGLPFDYDTANLIVFGVPWEVTVSYHAGTARGPQRILQASPQLDLYDLDCPDGWQQGIYLAPIPDWIEAQNQPMRSQAARVIAATEQGIAIEAEASLRADLAAVNQAGERVNHWLQQQAEAALALGKQVAVIGGDHSVPLGYIQALATRYPEFGVLQIDAHADLRQAYQGFQFSHASIMHNVLTLPQMTRLVQVGVRDICHDEVALIHDAGGRVMPYYDAVLREKRYGGTPWLGLCQQMVAALPQQVYISFDVDGLDPKLCPHTGTPVPGGLDLEEAFCLCREVVRSGRHIIGFDVSEVGDDEWDGNVGARILYKLSNLMMLSQGGALHRQGADMVLRE
ncbi:N(1)-aminopropylagmatine ureohydrolase [Halomicronema hongdechloris C2206]|uniref:N(1)-aminopropylagmatine ureohydrolase n=1 Tax=Halomicronema hongdechloris C2206 TaxID=1641165 RepID=A0A1Z3HKR8_9CYAN|nr:agmatinase family protein [Halomicronema hongdechloris]ASC70856.1 N(1)-aminopropylagmatine ureohydrolase [Halomicronema hongdechloris C2206]